MKKHLFKRRHRFLTVTVCVCLLMIIAAASLTYMFILPSTHFRNLPIVSNPATSIPENTSGLASGSTNSKNASQYDRHGNPLSEKSGTFNILLLGIDARIANEAARTDTIVLIHVDLAHHVYDALSIPRDLRVDVPPYGETKITHANYMGELSGGLPQGTKDIIQTISNLTRLTINYYAETNYWGLQGIVDSLGGIKIDVPFPVYMDATWYPEDAGKTIPKGNQFLNGKVVADLVHQRHYVTGGDFGRQRLQEEALIGIAHRVLSPTGIQRLPQFINAIPSFLVTTNVSKTDMLSLALAMKGFNSNQVHYFQVPGYAWTGKDPIVGANLDYWVADTQKLQKILKDNFE